MYKVLLISGCSSGFGKEFVIQAAQRKINEIPQYQVIATARNIADLDYCKQFANVFPIKLDVTVNNDIEAAINFVDKKFKKLNILINNAGVGCYSSFEEIDEKSLKYITNVNVFAPIFMIQKCLPLLKKSNEQSIIINMSSETGYFPYENAPIYSISKYALEGVSSNLRIYLKRNNIPIKVITINPGPYQTKFRQKCLNLNNTKIYDSSFPSPEKTVSKILDQLNRDNLPSRIICGKDAINQLKFTTKLYEEEIKYSSEYFLDI